MDFIQILVMASQLILGLSILVGVHELGHMLAAKKFGMRVEKFSIGFPPKIFGIKKGETEYSIGAIPLGGFVKISGMVDESLDTKNLSQEPEPWEFRAKPAWQRLIVMLGGIIVNVLVGILIFVGVTWFYGEEYLSATEVNKKGIVAYGEAKKIGLQTGDRIIAINGKPYEDFYKDTKSEVLLNSNSYYTVLRDGKEITVKVPNNLLNSLADKKDAPFIEPISEFEIGKVENGTPAAKANLLPKDRILKVNGASTEYFHNLQEVLKANKNKPVALEVKRGDKLLTINATLDTAGRLGFIPVFLIPTSKKSYSFFEAIPRGAFLSVNVVVVQIKALGKIFRRELSASKSFGSFLTIGEAYGGKWIWERFWIMTGTLSMILAFMNLLPIPALDGGHVMFLSYEIITRRKPSDKFLENAQKVGMVILLTLMVFALGNDVYKYIFK